jgi:hypothetical protein
MLRTKAVTKNDSQLLLISGLQVRVLPGSPLVFNKLESFSYCEAKNCTHLGPLPA